MILLCQDSNYDFISKVTNNKLQCFVLPAPSHFLLVYTIVSMPQEVGGQPFRPVGDAVAAFHGSICLQEANRNHQSVNKE